LIRRVQTPALTRQVYDEQIAAAQAATNPDLAAQLTRIRDLSLKGEKAAESDAELKASTDKIIRGRLSKYSSLTSICINLGAFLGMYCFGPVSQRIGRKPTFVIALLGAFASTATVFWFLQEWWQIFVLVPIMGFFQLSLFGGYAIYFPELFPTRLRSTGTSFCYNVGRFVAALGLIVKAVLSQTMHSQGAVAGDTIRKVGVTMCAVFIIGLFVLPFLPETKGKPLPE
jgi:MFS family permease